MLFAPDPAPPPEIPRASPGLIRRPGGRRLPRLHIRDA